MYRGLLRSSCPDSKKVQKKKTLACVFLSKTTDIDQWKFQWSYIWSKSNIKNRKVWHLNAATMQVLSLYSHNFRLRMKWKPSASWIHKITWQKSKGNGLLFCTLAGKYFCLNKALRGVWECDTGCFLKCFQLINISK